MQSKGLQIKHMYNLLNIVQRGAIVHLFPPRGVSGKILQS